MKIVSQKGFTHVAIAVIVAVVAAIGGVGYYVLTKDDSKGTSDETAVKTAAKEHFALVYQKKTQEAYDVTCQDFKDLTSYTAFQSQLSQGGYYSLDLSTVEYTSVEVRNNQAKARGPVGPLQPGTDLEVSLLKKSGQWCVFGYEAK